MTKHFIFGMLFGASIVTGLVSAFVEGIGFVLRTESQIAAPESPKGE